MNNEALLSLCEVEKEGARRDKKNEMAGDRQGGTEELKGKTDESDGKGEGLEGAKEETKAGPDAGEIREGNETEEGGVSVSAVSAEEGINVVALEVKKSSAPSKGSNEISVRLIVHSIVD